MFDPSRIKTFATYALVGALYLLVAWIILALGLEPVVTIVLLLVVLLAWPLAWLLSSWLKRRAARQELGEMPPVTVPPHVLEDFTQRADEAVRCLRERQGAARGGDALYQLPWFLVAGPTGSGKTSLLIASKLHFYPTSAKQSPASLLETAPTRSIEWRLTDQAVFLDTAGRYQTKGEQEEWKALLETIKQHRRARPLDGLLLVVNAATLMAAAGEKELDLEADNIRARLNDVIALSGATAPFPVYLVFTHLGDFSATNGTAQGYQGFHDFFDSLSPKERGQIWGTTFDVDPKDDIWTRNERVLAQLEQSFDRLYQTLERDQLARFRQLSARDTQSRLSMNTAQLAEMARRQAGAFALPRSFQSSEQQRKLIYFIAALFRNTEYSHSPLLRSIFFTSSSATKENEGFFIEQLFKAQLVRDAALAEHLQTSRQQPRQQRLRLALLGAIGSLLLFLTGGLFYSFNENQRLIGRAQQAGTEVKNLPARAESKKENDVAEVQLMELQKVEVLRRELEQLSNYEQGQRPLSVRFGLYSGTAISPYLRTIYFEYVYQHLLQPTLAAMAAKLKDDPKELQKHPACRPGSESLDCYYDLLKSYVMLSQPDKTETTLLENQLVAYLKTPAGTNPEALKLAQEQLRFYAREATQEDTPHLSFSNDDPTIETARKILIDNYGPERKVSRKIFLAVEPQLPVKEIRLAPILKGKGNGWQSNYTVPGIYTLDGYRLFKKQIKPAIAGSLQEDWVLGPKAQAGQNQKPTEDQVEDFYLKQYSAQWQSFLKEISPPAVDKGDVVGKVKSWAESDNSPLRSLLEEVARQTNFSPPPGFAGWWSKLRGETGFAKKDNSVESDFSPLHTLVATNAGPSRLAKYLGKLNEFHPQIGMALRNAEEEKKFSEGLDGIEASAIQETGDWQGAAGQQVERLLRQPFTRVRVLFTGTVLERLEKKWEKDVFPLANQFTAAFNAGFPFVGESNASVDELARLLNPVDGTLTMLEQEARENIEGDRTKFTDQFLAFLEKSEQLRKALFSKNEKTMEVGFQLQVKAAPPLGTEIIIKVNTNELKYSEGTSGTFTWPGGTGLSGASIRLVQNNAPLSPMPPSDAPGAVVTPTPSPRVLEKQGGWGLFQLIQAGGGNLNNLHWSVGTAISATLIPSNTPHPFERGIFQGWKPPQKILN